MDAQFWIYIVIGVIYIVSTLLKKKDPESPEVPETQRHERKPLTRTAPPPTEAPRQLTFEELLREITEGKQSRPRLPEPQPEPMYERYEKEMGEEARSLEEVSVNEVETARRWKPYEEIPVASSERKSLEETLLLEDKKIEFGRFEAFERKDRNKLLADYVKLMRNPESLKQAVVMSEILKRKF